MPATSEVEVDPENGTLKRLGSQTKTNPYDLFALATALRRLKEQAGERVDYRDHGTSSGEQMMKDALFHGALTTLLFCQTRSLRVRCTRHFPTLRARGNSRARRLRPDHLRKADNGTRHCSDRACYCRTPRIPHTPWVSEICYRYQEKTISVRQDLFSITTGFFPMIHPCLITVDKDIFVPRLPSYRLKKATADRPGQIPVNSTICQTKI